MKPPGPAQTNSASRQQRLAAAAHVEPSSTKPRGSQRPPSHIVSSLSPRRGTATLAQLQQHIHPTRTSDGLQSVAKSASAAHYAATAHADTDNERNRHQIRDNIAYLTHEGWRHGRRRASSAENLHPRSVDPKTVRISGQVDERTIDSPANGSSKLFPESFSQHFKFFEIEYEMDPDLVRDPHLCTMFACKILALLGLQLALLLGFVIIQLHDVFPRSDVSSYIHLALYISLYIFVRAFQCGHKYPENLLYFAFMTYMILYSVGNFDYGPFANYIIIYLATIICSLWSLVVYVVEVQMDMRRLRVYILAILYFLLFCLANTISACLMLDRPGRPFYRVLKFQQLAVLFPIGLASMIVIIFELQRILHGRRVSLLKNEWATAVMILPLSFLFPAYLLRKCRIQCRRWSSRIAQEPGDAQSHKHVQIVDDSDKNSGTEGFV